MRTARKVKWYGMFHCVSRNTDWHKSVAHEFPQSTKPEEVAALLAYMAYFPQYKNETWVLEPTEANRELLDDSMFHDAQLDRCGTAWICEGEEWNGGIGTNKTSVLKAYAKSEAEMRDREGDEAVTELETL